MNCLKCGQLNAANARFCARCGQLLPAVPKSELAPGQLMDNGQYRVTRQLGKGGMGAVYLAQNTQAFDRLCIIKEMIAYYDAGEEAQARERFVQEARILAALKHPNIPDMYGFFSETAHNYIVMEYIEGQNLEQLLEAAGGALPLADAVRYATEICRVLEYLASVKPDPVVHCDIKPANIIVEQNSRQAMLVDFGTARSRYRNLNPQQPNPAQQAAYGTVGYAPPELYRGEAVPKSDVFSLAATLYHLASGDDPREHPFQWPGLVKLPPSLAAALQAALASEITQRSSAEQLRQALEAYRAAGAPGPTLVFPDGNQASTLTGFLDLAMRNWAYAREILYDGTLSAWFTHTLGEKTAAQQAEAAVRQYPQLQDGGLDLLLRSLNSRLPAPAVAVAPQDVEVTLQPGEQPRFTVTLSNGGPTGCRGVIRVDVPWLVPSETQYALAPGEARQFSFEVQADSTSPASTLANIQFIYAVGLPTKVNVKVRPQAAPAALQPRVPIKPVKPALTAVRKPQWLRWLAVPAGLLVIAAIVFLTLQRTTAPSDVAVASAVAALENGTNKQAFAVLSRIPAGNTSQVERAGRALDTALVTIPAGQVFLGGQDALTADGATADVPAFSLQRFEVTNLQWQRYVNSGGSPPDDWVLGRYPQGQALYPVTGITWQMARDYAAWVGLRLPGEAEWMLAARGTAGRSHPWGNEDDPTAGNYLSSSRTEAHLAQVGSYPRDVTPEGLFDMAGNVREWTVDTYAPYHQPYTPPRPGGDVVVVGASFLGYDQALWARERVPVTDTASDLGFRCAR